MNWTAVQSSSVSVFFQLREPDLQTLSMGLAPTSQTIQNRHYQAASCKAGAQSMSQYPHQLYTSLTCLYRCTTPAKDLDSGQYGHRSQVHAELLVEEFELGMLWDEYGLVRDIVVSYLFLAPLHVCLWLLFFSAIHKWFSQSRYQWAAVSWPITSADQRCL